MEMFKQVLLRLLVLTVASLAVFLSRASAFPSNSRPGNTARKLQKSQHFNDVLSSDAFGPSGQVGALQSNPKAIASALCCVASRCSVTRHTPRLCPAPFLDAHHGVLEMYWASARNFLSVELSTNVRIGHKLELRLLTMSLRRNKRNTGSFMHVYVTAKW